MIGNCERNAACKTTVRKKTFQSNANRLLADRCMGYTVNKFEQVGGKLGRGSISERVLTCPGGWGWGQGRWDPQVNKFAHVRGVGGWHHWQWSHGDPLNRGMTENINLPQLRSLADKMEWTRISSHFNFNLRQTWFSHFDLHQSGDFRKKKLVFGSGVIQILDLFIHNYTHEPKQLHEISWVHIIGYVHLHTETEKSIFKSTLEWQYYRKELLQFVITSIMLCQPVYRMKSSGSHCISAKPWKKNRLLGRSHSRFVKITKPLEFRRGSKMWLHDKC